jgi:predicted MFS family arabinose efflux permease
VFALPSILHIQAFRRVWVASLFSNAGSWFQAIAAGWLVYTYTGSAGAVGALSLVARLPAIGFSTVAGHLADRYDRRHVGILTGLGQALGALTLAVAGPLGIRSTPLIFVATFFVGLGFALGLPAMLALIGEIPGRDRLPEAIRVNAAGINVARAIGPAIAGGVLALFGPTVCFAVNAVSFLGLVFVLARLPAIPARAGLRNVTTGDALHYAAKDPAARRLLVGASVFCILAAPIQELAPAISGRVGGGGAATGLLLASMGAGALLGAWLLSHHESRGLPRHIALPMGSAAAAVGVGIVAMSPWLWFSMVGMAFGGAFWIWIFTLTNTAIQLTSPPELVGRMLGLYQAAVVGPISLGAFAAGQLGDVIGIGRSLGICAVALAAWGAWSLAHPVAEIDRVVTA